MQEAETAALNKQLAQIRDQDGAKDKMKEILANKEKEMTELKRILESQQIQLADMYNDQTQFKNRIAELESDQARRASDFFKELESAGDAFMPKSQLQRILNAQAAEIDELRRLISKPAEAEKRRVWDENLQTFVEVPANSLGPSRDAALDKLQSTFGHDQTKPRTRMDLELELAATKREYRELETEVKNLRELQQSLAAAKAEVAKATVFSGSSGDRKLLLSPDLQDESDTDGPHVPPSNIVRKVSRDDFIRVFKSVEAQKVTQDISNSDRRALFLTSKSIDFSPELQDESDTDGPASSATPSTAAQPISAKQAPQTKPKPALGASKGRSTATPSNPINESNTTHTPQSSAKQAAIDESNATRTDLVFPTPKGLPHADADAPVTLEGEEWMFDPRLQNLLKIKEVAREQVQNLRRESHAKIARLRLTQKHRPGQLNFREKMAYFTTAKLHIHEDILKEEESKADFGRIDSSLQPKHVIE